MNLSVFVALATFLALAEANTVVYRYGDGNVEYPDQGGKWVAVQTPGQNYYREPVDNPSYQRTVAGPCSHNHQHYATGNPVGYSRYQPSYQYYQPYPVIYYIVPPVQADTPPLKQEVTAKPIPGAEVQTKSQQVAYSEQSTEATSTATTAVPVTASPTTKQPSLVPKIPTVQVSTWQSYLCSVFPYLPSCQSQAQTQVQHSQPHSTYHAYSPYPGYSQLAQNPVYYIVQPEFKPQVASTGNSGSVGVIKIIGPNPVKVEATASTEPPVKAAPVVPPSTESPDTVVTVVETKSETVSEGNEEPKNETKVSS